MLELQMHPLFYLPIRSLCQERMHLLLEALGNPHRRFRSVHVAGTKGTGSTAALLASALREAGYRTGCYSSPHVVSMEERVRVDDQEIELEELDALLAAAAPAAERLRPRGLSHFELLTAVAFEHFAAHGVEVAVVEAGLGGARDATNVFSAGDLAASVITPVGRDHLEALGGDLRGVAQAKAGVIKAGRPLVLAPQPEAEAESLILEQGACEGGWRGAMRAMCRDMIPGRILHGSRSFMN